jgi:RNA polymerase sigma-70 factor (ECF subfamily)
MAPIPSAQEGPDELLARVARGDAGALRSFYELTVDGLYAFVFYRVGKDAALAEDVVQETFLVALERTHEFIPSRGSLRSWVCQLSRNVVRAQLRHRNRMQELDMWDRVDRALVEALARMEREALVDDVLAREETRDLVHLAMDQISDGHRQVLQRKYLDGKSLSELSFELGVSEDAVKSLLARARRAFREAFQTLGKSLLEASS